MVLSTYGVSRSGQAPTGCCDSKHTRLVLAVARLATKISLTKERKNATSSDAAAAAAAPSPPGGTRARACSLWYGHGGMGAIDMGRLF